MKLIPKLTDKLISQQVEYKDSMLADFLFSRKKFDFIV